MIKSKSKYYASTNSNFSFSSRIPAIFVTIWLLLNSCPSPYPKCQRLFTRSFRFCQVIVSSQSPHARKNLWYPRYISRVFATIGSSIFSRSRRALTDCVNPSFPAHVRQSGFRNPGKFACEFRNPWLWNPEYSSQRIWNPTSDWNPESSSTQKDWNPAPGIRNPWRGIRNPRLSWIPFYVEMLFLICYQDTGFAEVITYRCLFYLFSVVDEEAKNSREHFLLKCKRMAGYSPERYTPRLDDSSGCGTVTSICVAYV